MIRQPLRLPLFRRVGLIILIRKISLPRQYLEDDAPQGPQVPLLIIVPVLLHFRGHVARSPHISLLSTS